MHIAIDTDEAAAISRQARGGNVVLRPIRPHDAAVLDTFFAALSPQTRLRRFHFGLRRLPPGLLERFTHPDNCDEMALLALHTDAGRDICIGEARYGLADGHPGAREFGIAVADAWQGRGIGRRLLQHLTRHARRSGVAELHGDVLRDNLPMLAMAKTLGFASHRHPDDARLLRVARSLQAVPAASPDAAAGRFTDRMPHAQPV